MMQRMEFDQLGNAPESTFQILSMIEPGTIGHKALQRCVAGVTFCRAEVLAFGKGEDMNDLLRKGGHGLLFLDAKTMQKETLQFLSRRDSSQCCAYVVVLDEAPTKYSMWIGHGADDVLSWGQLNQSVLERFVAFGLRARRQCQETQRLQRKQDGFFASSSEGTWCLDAYSMSVEVSRKWQEMVGLSSHVPSTMSLHEWLSFFHKDDRQQLFRQIRSYLSQEKPPSHTKYRLAVESGSEEWWSSKVQGVYNHTGKCEHVLGWQVPTESKSKDSNYDSLTKLPNRKSFLEQVNATFERLKGGLTNNFALIYIGLNQFHRLNDTLGFDVGDQLLQQVAERLRTTQRFINTMIKQESRDNWEQAPRFRAKALPDTSALLDNTLHGVAGSSVKVVVNSSPNSAGITLQDFAVGYSASNSATLPMGMNVPALVARFDGDKFALLIEHVDGPEDAALLAQRIQHLLERPFVVGKERIYLSASTGVAHSSVVAETAQELLRKAGFAMCKAKEGQAGSVLFSTRIHKEAAKKLRIETALREALQRKQLHLFYQPMVCIRDASILGFEALLRWEHPEMGWISPGSFIPIAEETGLIVDIGAWVLEEACKQIQTWRQTLQADLTVSVNVSGKQLVHPNWEQNVEAALLLSELPPEALKLEVTESCLVSELDTREALQQLRKRGICVQIDDFGTGYSSLARLQDMPADVVKIDQSFVRDMVEKPSSDSIIRAVVKLSQHLGFRVVAEGIESQEQWEHLQSIGVGMGQGYLFGRPTPSELIPALLFKGVSSTRELPKVATPLQSQTELPPQSRTEHYSTVETPLPDCLLFRR